MKARAHGPRLLILAALACLEACATTDTPQTAQVQPAPRRRRRRRATVESADSSGSASVSAGGATGPVVIGAASTNAVSTNFADAADGGTSPAPSNAPTGSFGTAVVNDNSGDANATWIDDGYGGHVVCDNAPPRPAVVSPQCPLEPGSAMIVRAFVPVERSVLRCDPPANREGRLPVRVAFNGSGAPREIRFPGVSVDRARALCIGRALCPTRMPSFRATESTVNYEYVVLIPDATK